MCEIELNKNDIKYFNELPERITQLEKEYKEAKDIKQKNNIGISLTYARMTNWLIEIQLKNLEENLEKLNS